MSDPLGLSVGTTNLVAARVGAAPVTRRPELTLFAGRAPEVGTPSENPNLTEPGTVMGGFVERIGDGVPMVAGDGSTFAAETLLAEALQAMLYTVGGPAAVSSVVIAVPAYWAPATRDVVTAALRTNPSLSPNGLPPPVISDATAALTALHASPGLAARGVVALLDFGGSGTSITLADAGSNFEPIDETVRYTEFSGNQIEYALLTNVLNDMVRAGNIDAAGTASVASLSRLREGCRYAKERLSQDTVTQLVAELPGYRADIRVTRAELESMIRAPLDGVISALEEMLERNRIAPGILAAVATVGGGASIPLITQRLSERLRVPLVTTAGPALNVAAGAALLAARERDAGASTAAAFAAAAAVEPEPYGGESATFRALAWSQDDGADEPVPYTGQDYAYEDGDRRPRVQYVPATAPPAKEPLRWYRPQLLVGLAAVIALTAVGGLAYTLTGTATSAHPDAPPATATPPPPPPTSAHMATPAPPPTTQPVTVVPSTTPPAPPPPPPSPSTTTVTRVPTTTPWTPTTTPPTTPTTTATTTTTTTTTTTPHHDHDDNYDADDDDNHDNHHTDDDTNAVDNVADYPVRAGTDTDHRAGTRCPTGPVRPDRPLGLQPNRRILLTPTMAVDPRRGASSQSVGFEEVGRVQEGQ